MDFKKRVKNELESLSEFLGRCGKVEEQENFKSDREFMYHQYNICYPVWEKNTAKMLSKYYVNRYDDELRSVKASHDSGKASGFPRETFYQCISMIVDEDKHYASGKARRVSDRELVFVLKAICSRILSDSKKDKETFLAYKYFTCDATKDDYFKYTGKMPNRNSIGHVFKVLENYGFIHRRKLNRKATRFFIGKKNPLYLLEMFPDIVENDVQELSVPRKIKQLEKMVEMFKSNLEPCLN
jgi:hypothetical protein